MPDPSSRKLVIPSGSSFESTERGLVIEAAHDIVLSGPVATRVARITSTQGSIALSGELLVDEVHAVRGSVAISGRAVAESVNAGGPVLLDGQVKLSQLHARGPITLRGTAEVGSVSSDEAIFTEGRVSAELLRAPTISVTSGDCTAKAIDGGRTITLGEARLTVEIVIAPEVRVAPQATGRVNVIECHNQLAPNGLKGGFGLTEYAEFTGIDPDEFLTRRGVRRLLPPGEAAAAPAPSPSVDLSEDLITLNSEQDEPEPLQQEVSEADLEPVEQTEELDLDAAHVAAPHDEYQAQLLDTIDQIASAYDGGEEPPSITSLRQMVLGRDYERVRAELTPIWNDLIRFHQKRNLRVAHKVTIKFNALNSLVRKGA